MSIKASYRYQLCDIGRSTAMFYAIYAAVMIFFSVFFAFSTNIGGSVSSGGQEMAGLIFIFVVGLCSFKDSFGFMTQSGVSRRSQFLGHLATTVTIALGMAVMDQILGLVFRLLSMMPNTNYYTMFEMMYGLSSVGDYLTQFVYSIMLYTAFLSIGYFITLMFYRLSKLGKALVGAGVPVLLVMVLPNLDYMLTGGQVYAAIGRFIAFAFGLQSGNAWMAVVSFLLITVVARCLAWLLMRRAVVKR